MQSVTLADLFHCVHGSLVFELLKLGNLDKRPNVQRQAIYMSESGCPGLLTRQLQVVERHLIQALVAGCKERGLRPRTKTQVHVVGWHQENFHLKNSCMK